MESFTFFTKPIFYGNGNAEGTGPSDLAVNEVNKQIAEVHSINSSLQQPCHCDYPCHCERMNLETHKLKRALGESIKKALGI